MPQAQINTKRLELLVQAVPRVQRLALMSNLDSTPDNEIYVRAAAELFGLQTVGAERADASGG